ncbi:MAG: hypothetical protein U0694_23675 [Anaerolineae bacterium]
MSSRRRRNSNANIPQETLDRARRQAEGGAEEEKPAAPVRAEAPASRARANAAPSARRSSVPGGQTVRKRKNDDKMDPSVVADILAHPTKVVTEQELREHYSFVVADLRNMGLLALGLMVALVILAQILPK